MGEDTPDARRIEPDSFSVVICAYSSARWDSLVAATRSVERQSLAAHEIVVVVDHNDELRARAERSLPQARVVANTGTRGLSDARNSGVRAAEGSIVVFLDDDAVADGDWLRHLAQAYGDSRTIGVGGEIAPNWSSGQAPPWFPEEFNWVVGCSYRGVPEERAPVRNLIGCNMSYRREAFAAVGGFEIGRTGALSIGNENDETDFCIRLGRALPASVLLFEPQARVQHAVPAERATARYFVRRCYSEGVSKARLARLVGAEQGLSSERDYVRRTLSSGLRRELRSAIREREMAGLMRAAAIAAGLAVTSAGYAVGAWRTRR
jgi:glycosyltransferase involved in cell wall biosynthesis